MSRRSREEFKAYCQAIRKAAAKNLRNELSSIGGLNETAKQKRVARVSGVLSCQGSRLNVHTLARCSHGLLV